MIRLRLLLVLSALVLALAACASDAADEPVGSEAASPPTVVPDAPSDAAPSPATGDDGADASPAAAGAATVATGETTDHGAVLTDADGMTLYAFLEDEQGDSTCYDACADAWPPLLTDGDPAAEGDADASLLGTVERQDGGVQVTYDGQPLYLYTGDSASGDVNGFGSGDVWYPVAPDGAVIDAASHSEHTTDDGY